MDAATDLPGILVSERRPRLLETEAVPLFDRPDLANTGISGILVGSAIGLLANWYSAMQRSPDQRPFEAAERTPSQGLLLGLLVGTLWAWPSPSSTLLIDSLRTAALSRALGRTDTQVGATTGDDHDPSVIAAPTIQAQVSSDARAAFALDPNAQWALSDAEVQLQALLRLTCEPFEMRINAVHDREGLGAPILAVVVKVDGLSGGARFDLWDKLAAAAKDAAKPWAPSHRIAVFLRKDRIA